MAMTKAEKARVVELEQELAEAKALRFTDKVSKDVHPPKALSGVGRVVTGYVFNAYYESVEEAWTTSVSHGRGQYNKSRSGSQNSISMYSSPLRALRAMRNAAEQEAACKLAKIDKLIAKHMAEELGDQDRADQ